MRPEDSAAPRIQTHKALFIRPETFRSVDHETLRFLFRLFRFDEFTTMEKNTSRVTMIFSGRFANEIDPEYKYTSIGLIRNTAFYMSQRIEFFKHFTVYIQHWKLQATLYLNFWVSFLLPFVHYEGITINYKGAINIILIIQFVL